jgi:hypothetical protein
MDHPSEEKEPENRREAELNDGAKESALEQLTQAGNEDCTTRR